VQFRIRRFKRTSLACPSQWEIELQDGRWMYVHYRHGRLEATIGGTFVEALRAQLDKGGAFSKVVGKPDDGHMSNSEMAGHVGLIGKIPKDKEIRFDIPWVRVLAKKLKTWDET